MTRSAGQPDPAAAFFAAKLRALMSESQVRNIETGKIRKLTPLSMLHLIKHTHPDADISQSQLYRYVRGERAPRLDELAVIASVFGVSPRVFVPTAAARKP
jgi:transcriptional regulator with XRE-family HTH domain